MYFLNRLQLVAICFSFLIFLVPGELFGQEGSCNDDGQVNIADAICKLSFLFSGGPAPPAPHPSCGNDSTADAIDGLSFPPCN